MIKKLENNKGQLRVKSEKSLPIWSIVHYLNRVSINYIKLLTIERVCQALADGCLDEDLIVAEQSAYLMSSTPFDYDTNITYRTLANKGDNYKEFWNIIKTHHRPIVLRRLNNAFVPVIDIKNDDLIINNLTVTSPPDLTLSGIGTTLSDLYYAGEREERSRQAHANEQIGQAAQNISQMASAQVMLNNPNLKTGVKSYLEDIMMDIMRKQAELNQEMGLVSASINETA